jgi:hypothetical protein
MPPVTPDAPSPTPPDGAPAGTPDVAPPASPDVAADATGGTWATRAHTGVVGDDAMAAATGHPRAHWFALLDDAGASGWPHREIARWLVEAQAVDPWWAQGLTVGYEQARGIRVPGQRQDGSFESSSSRTVPVEVPDAYRLVADAAVRDQWLDVPVEVTGETAGSSVRWTLPDGSRAVVRVQAVRPGATRIAVQHGRLPDAGAVTASKAYWSERLERLGTLAAGR